jgi:N4-gp56 family major capsid protein
MASSTSGLSNLMQIFYDKKFLDRAKALTVFADDAQKRNVPRNSGKTVYWNRFTPLAAATTPLTEGTNPSGSDMTTTIVSATVAEYGDFVKVNSLFNLTSIDEGLSEHSDVMGQQAGETVDTLVVAQLSANATAQLAGAKSALTAIAATDTFTGAEVRKAVRTLKGNKAMRFSDGYYHGISQPFTEYDLFGNSEWQNIAGAFYTDPSNAQKGFVGQLHGVKFKTSNASSTESSTVTVYHNYIYGQNSYGIVDIASTSEPSVIVKTPGPQDTSNPLNMFTTIGWKMTFATKVLNANWIINVKAGATA